jgi:hypothetical protein
VSEHKQSDEASFPLIWVGVSVGIVVLVSIGGMSIHLVSSFGFFDVDIIYYYYC